MRNIWLLFQNNEWEKWMAEKLHEVKENMIEEKLAFNSKYIFSLKLLLESRVIYVESNISSSIRY
jgi:hypothetical protein